MYDTDEGGRVDEPSISGLAQLGAIIRDPAQRKACAADPDGTLAQDQIDLTAIPPNLIATLVDLTHEELRALGRVRQSLLDSGASLGDIAEIV